MKKEQLIADLKKLQVNGDTEAQHSLADDLLIDYINDPEIKAEYNKIDKWYA